MVANALEIAERELKGLDAAGHSMLGALSLLYGEDADDALSGEDLRQRVEALQHRLCIEIAAGDFDNEGQDVLMDSLEAIVKLQPDFIVISNDSDFAEDEGRAFLLHPALEHFYPPSKRLVVPERLTVCGGPMVSDALDRIVSEITRAEREVVATSPAH